MPRIQMIHRDSSVTELDADNVGFDFTRMVTNFPIAVINTRLGLDLNQTSIGITVDGIFTDDVEATGGNGASMTIDTSLNGSQSLASTWYELFASWNAVKAELDGVKIRFQTTGQINAGLGEDTTLELKNASGSSTVATNSIVVIDISSTTTSDSLADTIVSGINGASIKINTATVACSSVLTVSQSSGQHQTLSMDVQSGSGFDGEKITIKNTVVGSNGDHITTVSKDDAGATWTNQFLVTNMTGGSSNQKKTMEDKVQDLLNLSNMSAGGALVSPNAIAGSVIDIPDGVSSVDASRFLRIDGMKTVQKYVVGLRIPYESLASSPDGNKTLRQYLIPSGVGTNFSAVDNDKAFDPTTTVNNEIIRPNPYLEQGVAIPVVLRKFNPSYNAGDGYWTYQMVFEACEQLVGI